VSTFRLFVVRHAETEWTRERRFTGWHDVPLSERGQAQAAAAARTLATHAVTAVYASPLERARMSAETIAKAHRLDVRLEPAFREMGFGAWEGLTRDEVTARFPEPFATWRDRPERLTDHRGETLDAVGERVNAALDRLERAHAGETVILVTHGVVIRLIVLRALGLGSERLWAVDASPAGISELEFAPGWVTLHRMNTVAHLDGLGTGPADRGAPV
jgi:broad specificity phosphatase PhoE